MAYKPSNSWWQKYYTPTQFNVQQSPYKNQKYKTNYAYDVSGAKTALNQHNMNKPGEYKSQHQDNINGLIKNMANRKQFSYDSTGDALYDMYKDKAVEQGQLKAKDTMGQAVANTGGFGNSYAQIVSQQAYNSSMNDLQNKIPGLAEMALNKYNAEGENLKNMLSIYQDQEATDYGRHRDTVSDWQAERQLLNDFYLAQQQLDRSAFDSDRAFKEAAWEFAQNQRYNAWSDSETRRQNQINADNSNALATWSQEWQNYLNQLRL